MWRGSRRGQRRSEIAGGSDPARGSRRVGRTACEPGPAGPVGPRPRGSAGPVGPRPAPASKPHCGAPSSPQLSRPPGRSRRAGPGPARNPGASRAPLAIAAGGGTDRPWARVSEQVSDGPARAGRHPDYATRSRASGRGPDRRGTTPLTSQGSCCHVGRLLGVRRRFARTRASGAGVNPSKPCNLIQLQHCR